MSTQTRPMTAEELFWNGPDQPCELIDGELRMIAPAGEEHGGVAGNLHALLWHHVRKHKLGRVFAAETGYLLARNPDTVLAPDTSFVRADRLRPPGKRRGYLPLAPDLAVEVVSPSQSAQEVQDKVDLWLKHGTAMVWVAWPDTHSIAVHRTGRPVLILHEADRLEGGDVVEGFVCGVSEVFE